MVLKNELKLVCVAAAIIALVNIAETDGLSRRRIQFRAESEDGNNTNVVKSDVSGGGILDAQVAALEGDNYTEMIEKPDKKLLNVPKIVISIIKSMIGPGVLYHPAACAQGGYALYVITLIGVGALSTYAVTLLITARDHINPTGKYGDVMRTAVENYFGESKNIESDIPIDVENQTPTRSDNRRTRKYGEIAGKIVDASVILNQIGVAASYFIVVPTLLMAGSPWIKANFSMPGLMAIMWAIVGPLSWIRKVSKLAGVNIIADVLIVVSLVLMYNLEISHILSGSNGNVIDPSNTPVHAASTEAGSTIPSEAAVPGHVPIPSIHNNGLGIEAVNSRFFPNFLVMLGTILYSYEGIGTVTATRDAMADGKKKFNKTYSMTIGLVTAIYGLSGVLGYFAYGDKVDQLVLLSMEGNGNSALANAQAAEHVNILGFIGSDIEPVVNTIRIAMALAVVGTFPYMLLPATAILEDRVFGKDRQKSQNLIQKMKKNAVRLALVTFLALFAYGAKSNLENMVSLVGCFCGVPMALIFPALAHMLWVMKSDPVDTKTGKREGSGSRESLLTDGERVNVDQVEVVKNPLTDGSSTAAGSNYFELSIGEDAADIRQKNFSPWVGNSRQRDLTIKIDVAIMSLGVLVFVMATTANFYQMLS